MNQQFLDAISTGILWATRDGFGQICTDIYMDDGTMRRVRIVIVPDTLPPSCPDEPKLRVVK